MHRQGRLGAPDLTSLPGAEEAVRAPIPQPADVHRVGEIAPAAVEGLLAMALPTPASVATASSVATAHRAPILIVLGDPADTASNAPPATGERNAALLDWLSQLAAAESASRGKPRLFLAQQPAGDRPAVTSAGDGSLLAAVREIEQLALSGAPGLAARLEQLAESLRLGATLEERAPALHTTALHTTTLNTWRDPRSSASAKFAGLAARLRANAYPSRARSTHLAELHSRLVAHVQRRELEREHEQARDAARRDAATARLTATLASTSWRVTAPLRAFGRALGRARGRTQARGAEPPALPTADPPRARGRLALPPELDATSPQFRFDERLAEARERLAPYRERGRPAAITSLIVPVRGQLAMTVACLCSVARNLDGAAVEILVVDDGSPDATANVLGELSGIRFLPHTAGPQGFGAACNRGAQAAGGRYLHFLNNDTVVWPHWLAELLRLLADDPHAGIVGSKLISPEGWLREAGGLVWQDGSALNVGREEDPDRPEQSYVREVDYVSAASLLIHRQFFAQLSGFDSCFAPAYYEDTDLAFRARHAGFRVLYQPLSLVTHHEGATAGRDPELGIKAFQRAHQVTFRKRWSARLDDHQPPGQDLERARDRAVDRRALLVDAVTPTPDRDSGSLDAIGLLRALRRLRFRCWFAATSDPPHVGRYREDLAREGVAVLPPGGTAHLFDHLIVHGGSYDLVVLSRVRTAAPVLDAVLTLCPRAKIVFNPVDLHHLRVARRAELEGCKTQLELAERLRAEELEICRRAHATFVLSTAEKWLLEHDEPAATVRVLPFLREIPGPSAGFANRDGVLFLGGFRHPPNVDALRHFVSAIWPRLRRRRPGLRLIVVGSEPTPEVLAMAADDVDILGFVPDLAPILAAVRLTVAPVRYGAGIKGKVATSLAHGVPVVATTMAIEGMGAREGVDLLVADDAEAFGDAVLRLHDDGELWERLSRAGLRLARESFACDVGCRRLAVLLHELGVPSTLPADELFEIDVRCPDLESWQAWRAGHRELFDAGYLARVAATVANCGLEDPWSGRILAPQEVRLGDENFRESLAAAGFFSRTRGVILEWQALAAREPAFRDPDLRIYCPEAVTSFAAALRDRYPHFVGTEYAASEEEARRIAPHRHADLLALPFPAASFDLAITNDVLEHVADLDGALAELHRILAPGGALITTVPFLCDQAVGERRARLRDGELVHCAPPEYHGNPISAGGSLVFEIPGWDLLDRARAAGFVDVTMTFRASRRHGVLGREIPGVFILGARRAAAAPRRRRASSVVGVAGLPRSGTTLLTAVLAAHSRCAALYEPWNGAHDRLGYQRFDREALLRRVGLELPAAKTLVVKETSTSVAYLDCLEHLLATVPDPDAGLLCWIVRNPWHVYLSNIQARRDWWGEEGLEVSLDTLDAWLTGALAGLQRLVAMARRVPTVVVSYERLVERPGDVIAALMDAIGHRCEAGQLHYEERIDRLQVRGDVALWRRPSPIDAGARDRRRGELAARRPELAGSAQRLLDRLEEAAAPLRERDLAAPGDPSVEQWLAAIERTG